MFIIPRSSLDPLLLPLAPTPGGTSAGTSKHMKCAKKELCRLSHEGKNCNKLRLAKRFNLNYMQKEHYLIYK